MHGLTPAAVSFSSRMLSGAVAPAFLNPHLTHGICFTALVLCQDLESDWGRYLLTVSQNLGVPGVINCANSHFLRSPLGDPLG